MDVLSRGPRFSGVHGPYSRSTWSCDHNARRGWVFREMRTGAAKLGLQSLSLRDFIVVEVSSDTLEKMVPVPSHNSTKGVEKSLCDFTGTFFLAFVNPA